MTCLQVTNELAGREELLEDLAIKFFGYGSSGPLGAFCVERRGSRMCLTNEPPRRNRFSGSICDSAGEIEKAAHVLAFQRNSDRVYQLD